MTSYQQMVDALLMLFAQHAHAWVVIGPFLVPLLKHTNINTLLNNYIHNNILEFDAPYTFQIFSTTTYSHL